MESNGAKIQGLAKAAIEVVQEGHMESDQAERRARKRDE